MKVFSLLIVGVFSLVSLDVFAAEQAAQPAASPLTVSEESGEDAGYDASDSPAEPESQNSAEPAQANTDHSSSEMFPAASRARTVVRLRGDVNLDRRPDGVILMETGDSAEGRLNLRIVDSSGVTAQARRLVRAYPLNPDDMSTFGVTAEVNDRGTLVIRSQKDWGSSTWDDTVRVSKRNGQYVVSGYTHNAADRNTGRTTCDLNFLTGRAMINGRPVVFTPPANLQIHQVNNQDILERCQGMIRQQQRSRR